MTSEITIGKRDDGTWAVDSPEWDEAIECATEEEANEAYKVAVEESKLQEQTELETYGDTLVGCPACGGTVEIPHGYITDGSYEFAGKCILCNSIFGVNANDEELHPLSRESYREAE